ncbi:MAG: thiamine pyrophosphate-binding protein [Verrucomicrobiota bacterium]
MKRKVSDLIAEFLVRKGMKHVFGIVGAGNAHIFDSIYQTPEMEMVCVHHEQAGCMAMQTYYRTSGIVTASILTTGAGSTNGITGIVSAWADSIPCLVISGNEHSKYIRPDNPLRMYGVQGYDSTFMVSKVTKYSPRVMETKMVLFELEKAYFIAKSGRPGPCWVDIPMNIQSSLIEEDELVRFNPLTEPSPTLSTAELENRVIEIVGELRSAERPVIWLGHGIRLAGGEGLLPKLIENVPAAFLVSWAGIDMVDSDHPLVFGRAGVYGQRCANFVLQNCDYLLTIGTRLALPQVGYETSELARKAKVVVVDIDPTELQKYPERISMTVCADAKAFIEALLKATDQDSVARPNAWLDQCKFYRKQFPWIGEEHKDQGGFINSYPFMDRLHPHLKDNQIIVTDMGTALLSGHQILRTKRGQRLMTSTGLGEMGYGLPGAIGASFARNHAEVLCLNCDGGMMMNLQELQTLVHHQLPIKLIIFNNDGYLMIKHTQNALMNGRFAGTDKKSGISCPDFSKLATAFGLPSWQIRTWDDFDQVLPKLQQHDGPAICEVFMHPEQLFVPKLSLALQKDGTVVSPPLEDLSPLLARSKLREAMSIGLHAKSENLSAQIEN